MRPHHNPPNARTKIQDVLDMLRSNKVLLDPNTRYTKAEMDKDLRPAAAKLSDCDATALPQTQFCIAAKDWNNHHS